MYTHTYSGWELAKQQLVKTIPLGTYCKCIQPGCYGEAIQVTTKPLLFRWEGCHHPSMIIMSPASIVSCQLSRHTNGVLPHTDKITAKLCA